ncbi:MAG: hypothetical protein JWN38_128 [Candidatus Saccharibacteria bacterium]|nr:hypothetical protein [Candidatus Saccharibacteria bacterium]
MKKFIGSNIAWVFQYFDKNKGLLETFSFLMVAQTFMYDVALNTLPKQSIAAFRIVLWVMIFLIIVLLQISTVVDVRREDGQIKGHILSGANFMKTVMRLLTLVLLVAAVPIFIEQIQDSIHNRLFSVFYASLAIIIIVEVLTIGMTHFLPKSTKDN